MSARIPLPRLKHEPRIRYGCTAFTVARCGFQWGLRVCRCAISTRRGCASFSQERSPPVPCCFRDDEAGEDVVEEEVRGGDGRGPASLNPRSFHCSMGRRSDRVWAVPRCCWCARSWWGASVQDPRRSEGLNVCQIPRTVGEENGSRRVSRSGLVRVSQAATRLP